MGIDAIFQVFKGAKGHIVFVEQLRASGGSTVLDIQVPAEVSHEEANDTRRYIIISGLLSLYFISHLELLSGLKGD